MLYALRPENTLWKLTPWLKTFLRLVLNVITSPVTKQVLVTLQLPITFLIALSIFGYAAYYVALWLSRVAGIILMGAADTVCVLLADATTVCGTLRAMRS